MISRPSSGPGSGLRHVVPAGLAALVVALVSVVLLVESAEAQIWVVTGADGRKEYTTRYRPGAEKFMPTLHTPAPRRAAGVPYQETINDAAQTKGVDPLLVEAVIAAESAFDPAAISSKGAQGLMQLIPATAQRFGVADVFDPVQNIHGGTAYLAELMEMFGGNLQHVVAAYNAGENAVLQYGGIPPYDETRVYVGRVLDYYRRRSGQ